MNLPTTTAALATRALQPGFGGAVDIARQEIAALAAILGGVGLRDRRHRTACTGFRILPMLAGVLVADAEHVGGGVAGKGKIGLGRWGVLRGPRDRTGEIAVVSLGIGVGVGARHAAAASAEPD